VELPIDVVYTWVNGTDPILLRELNQLKREMRQKLEKEKLANQKKNGTADDQQKADIFNCPFANCVPWRTLVVSSDGHENYTHEDLAAWSNCMSTSLSFDRAESPHSKESAFFLRFKEENDVSICLELGLVDEEGAPVQCTRGYLTSDGSLADAISIPNFSVVTWNGSDPRRSITKRDFQKALSTALPRVSVLVDVAKNRTAVVEFKSEQDFSKVLEGKSSVNFQVKVGEESVELTVHSAHLVWTPFRFHNQWRDDTSQDGDIISANRFEDNEELKYSLRSLEKYAPWVRQVFIVTNGQIPHWLNLDNPRVTLVTHEEIFTNLSHLPTYSSPAIESHIHRIKGLSKQFIYFNDDVLLGEEVWPEDFYTTRKGQKVYLAWAVPYCSDGCPPNWINDKYCDSACNNSACEWDGDDCKNATRRTTSYTGQSSYTSTTSDNCNTGCLNNWLGDRYCDAACHVHNCGYDAGDCDVDKFHHLYSVDLQPDRANYSIPLGVKAMFFNLTGVFGNGTSVTKATFTTPSAVRTAVVSQKHKVLSFTFVRNVSLSSSQVLLEGKDSTGNSTIVLM
jgi:UDP-N-acetylglucosamine-lysosomal-enzyme